MKKFVVICGLVLVLFGCGGGLATLTYSSSELGLSFEYLSESFGAEVDVSETGDTVFLKTANGVIASIIVKQVEPLGEGHTMGDYLWSKMLNQSTVCHISEVSVTSKKEIYGFNSDVYPFGNEFDPNCLLTSEVYYFPAQPDKILVVSTGQSPAFEGEANQIFLDSIKLLP